MKADAARAAFDCARKDARLAADEVFFVPFSVPPPPTISAAAFYEPGAVPSPQEAGVLDASGLAIMQERRGKFRVTCYLGFPSDEHTTGIIRHELEHVVQFKGGGGTRTFKLAKALYEVLDHVGYQALPANGQVYNLIPIELDANGAASRFVRIVYGAEHADRLAREVDPGIFRRRPGPEDVETLPMRLICHASIWPEEIEAVLPLLSNEGVGLFDALAPGGRAHWDRLKHDETLARLRAAVRGSVPSASNISLDDPEAGWRPTKASIIGAVDHARALSGLPPTPS